jgi:curved DNA-binding protein
LTSETKPMNAQDESRREKRRALNSDVTLSWRDLEGNQKHIQARGIDISESGLRLESTELVEVHSGVHIQAEQDGFLASAYVRHCTRRGAVAHIGLEFVAGTKKPISQPKDDFVDYYELLQISPNAERETVHRVFRIMAARYHPDNAQTGDAEKFLLLTKAHETLSDPQRRAIYDSRYQDRQAQPIPIFELREFVEGIQGEQNRRMGILCLLYLRRRSNPEDSGVSLLELEILMSFPREHLVFTVWFLREKQYLRMEHNSNYVITAEGIEYVEAGLPSNQILYKLLDAPNEEAVTKFQPAQDPDSVSKARAASVNS